MLAIANLYSNEGISAFDNAMSFELDPIMNPAPDYDLPFPQFDVNQILHDMV